MAGVKRNAMTQAQWHYFLVSNNEMTSSPGDKEEISIKRSLKTWRFSPSLLS